MKCNNIKYQFSTSILFIQLILKHDELNLPVIRLPIFRKCISIRSIHSFHFLWSIQSSPDKTDLLQILYLHLLLGLHLISS